MQASILPATPQAAQTALCSRYAAVREASRALIAPLSAEDACVQSMPDASPAKWHLAHVTWFFETFVLAAHEAQFTPHHAAFRSLYNSYYNGIGAQFPRARRGLVTRPSLAEVLDYRAAVDVRMQALLAADDGRLQPLVELGLAHEEQHQELLLMDIKHLLSCNPLAPAYQSLPATPALRAAPLGWHEFALERVDIGHHGAGFHFDNEGPRHAVLLTPFALASRPVTNSEFRAFIEDGGYREPRWWLADGWATCQREAWQAPAYWQHIDGVWHEFTLGGLEALDDDAPVCHVSHYEADAYAAWAGARLPTEFEWEAVAAGRPLQGHFVDRGLLHPRAAHSADGPLQLFGDVWEWTASAYLPYPGFRVAAGAVGEYNGKFMSSQMVLRGGCCVTPPGHARATYRNFFYPHQRWAFSGIRLARDL